MPQIVYEIYIFLFQIISINSKYILILLSRWIEHQIEFNKIISRGFSILYMRKCVKFAAYLMKFKYILIFCIFFLLHSQVCNIEVNCIYNDLQGK